MKFSQVLAFILCLTLISCSVDQKPNKSVETNDSSRDSIITRVEMKCDLSKASDGLERIERYLAQMDYSIETKLNKAPFTFVCSDLYEDVYRSTIFTECNWLELFCSRNFGIDGGDIHPRFKIRQFCFESDEEVARQVEKLKVETNQEKHYGFFLQEGCHLFYVSTEVALFSNTIRELLPDFECLISNEPSVLKFKLACESLFDAMSNDYRLVSSETPITNALSINSQWNERYVLKSQNLFFNKYGQKDYQEYALSVAFFENKDTCMIARQKYLDNYSWLGELTYETKGVKRAPTFNLIDDHIIIILEVSCESEHEDDKWSWKNMQDSIRSRFGTGQSEIIQNGCGHMVSWENPRNR